DGSDKTYPNQKAFVLIGADTPVAWLEANNVRFVERPHLYTLGASDEVVRRMVPDARECPKTPAEAIALVLGQQAEPKPAKPKRETRSVVAHLRDEIRGAVDDLSGVFKISDLTNARNFGRSAPIPAERLARGSASRPSLKKRDPFADAPTLASTR